MINNCTVDPFTPYIKLAMMSFFFGGVFIGGRIIAGDVEPALAGFLRFSIAAIILVALTVWKEKCIPIPSPKQFIGLTALGLTGVFGYNLCLLTGLETVSCGRSAVIVAINPIFITLMSAAFFGEQLTRRKLFGIGLSVSGAVCVASHGHWNLLLNFSEGDIVVLIASFCWALYSIIGRYILTSLSPLIAVTYAAILGLMMLLPVALHSADFSSIRHFSATAWVTVFYMGLFGTVCAFLLYYQGIKTIGVVKAGTFINLIPISTIILALLILNEEMDASIVIGTIVTITGIFLINSQQKTISGTNA